jgi:hypothetical protein
VPAQSQETDPILELTLTLAAYEAACRALEAAAPEVCRSLGGAQAIMDRSGGGMRPHARGWWGVDLDDETWSASAAEQQRPYREGVDG